MREASESQTATGTDSHAFFVQSFNADEENPEAQGLIMSAPKLTMSEEDVVTAICRTFKQQFANLTFSKKMSFAKVDSDGQVFFQLEKKYCGKGDYPISGRAKLFSNECKSSNYNIKGSVNVDEENGIPKITFHLPLTAIGC